MRPGERLTAAAVDLAIVAGILYVADRLLDPVPVPAAVAAAAGLIALWLLGGSRSGLAIAATVGGGLIGAGLHLYRHLAGASPLPAEGIPLHVIFDSMAGLFAALAALTAALAVRGLRNRRRSRSPGS